MLVNYLSADKMIRCIGVDSTKEAKEACKIHGTSQVATAALGRVLTGAILLTRHLKNKEDTISVQIKGNGPLGGLIAISTYDCKVRGYVDNPNVEVPLKNRSIDIEGAIGKGNITVIKDFGMKELYRGSVPLISGDITGDLSCYLTQSEQILSIIGLGVLVSSNEVVTSGGFLIQLLPGADVDVLDEIDNRISEFPSLTQLLSTGAGIDDILKDFMYGYDIKKVEEVETYYSCNCSKQRIEKALISLGKSEIIQLIEDKKGAEVKCHFCKTDYLFSNENLSELLKTVEDGK